MIGNLYRGSNHSSKSTGVGNDFRSPFMYMCDDSDRTKFEVFSSNVQSEEASVATQCKGLSDRRVTASTYCSESDDNDSDDDSQSSFGCDYSVDVSQASFVIEADDDLDELEKELERFALKEEKQAAKKARKQASYIQLQLQKQQGQAPKKSADAGHRRVKSMEAGGERPKDARNSVRRTLSAGSGKKEGKSSIRRTLSSSNSEKKNRSASTTANQAARRASRRGSNKDMDDDNRSLGSNKSLKLSSLRKESNHSRGSKGSHKSLKKNRSASTTANRAARRASRRGSNKDMENDNRSVGSNKSLKLSALRKESNHSKGSQKLSNSNRSIRSMCPVKDQLFNVFGSMATSCLKTVEWDTYFPPVEDKDVNAMSPEVERTIRSKKLRRLQRLHKQGHSMTARNKQGESVVSLVCRAGCAEMLIYLVTEAKVSVRVKDHVGKTPLHEVAWAPTFEPSIAMMLMSDSPELLWAPDARGFLALDYAPKRAQLDWYEFLEVKRPMLKLALQFSRFKATSSELNQNQERLRQILEHRLESISTQEQQRTRL